MIAVEDDNILGCHKRYIGKHLHMSVTVKDKNLLFLGYKKNDTNSTYMIVSATATRF